MERRHSRLNGSQKRRRRGRYALRVAERAVVARVRAEDAAECRLPLISRNQPQFRLNWP